LIQSIKVKLYGSHEACGRARALIENLSNVYQISETENPNTLQLTSDSLTENKLVAVLAQSGIHGFKLNPTTK